MRDDLTERGPDVCPDCGAAKGSLNGPNPHPACYAGVYSAITAEGREADYGCLLRGWHWMRAHAEQAELAREALRAELAEANDRAAHATRRLVALRQAIPTLDHETTMDAVARLLRERDEALVMVAASKRAAQFARGLRAPGARAAALRLRSVVDVMREAAGEVAVGRTPSDDGGEDE